MIIVVTPYLVNEEESSQTQISQPMRDWYATEKEYADSREKIDFKEEAEPAPPPVTVEEPPPRRILPPSRINPPPSTRYNTDKKSTSTNKKPKNNDDIVEFRLDKETEEPFQN